MRRSIGLALLLSLALCASGCKGKDSADDRAKARSERTASAERCRRACASYVDGSLGAPSAATATHCAAACVKDAWTNATAKCVAGQRGSLKACDVEPGPGWRLDTPAGQLEAKLENAGVVLPRAPPVSPMREGISIWVTPKEVHVEGRKALWLACKLQGRACADGDRTSKEARLYIDPVNKMHAKRASLLIVPLKEAVARARKAGLDIAAELHGDARKEQLDRSRRAIVVMDGRIPYRVVAEVVYSVAMAGVFDLRFAVRGRDGVGAQVAAAPRRGSSFGRDRARKPLNLTVMLDSRGAKLMWEAALMADRRGPVIAKRQVEPSFCTAPLEGGYESRSGDCFVHDYAALYGELVKLKAEYSSAEAPERRLHVTATNDTPWSAVAQTMAAAACRREQDAYPTWSAWLDARPVMVGEACKELFPEIVFAMTD